MDRDFVHWTIDIQDDAMNDQEYLSFAEEFKSLNRQILDLIDGLPEEQQDVFWRFIYVGASMHLKIMEIAYIYSNPASLS